MWPFTTQKIQRIADLVIARETPKTDRDGYHYLYDPSHTKRPPTGFGRFYQTPKGWSTNPKYQHGKLPYDMVTGLTDSEIKQHLSTNPLKETHNTVEEHKQKIIDKFDYINENEIEHIEKLPSHLSSLVDPERFVTWDYNEYYVAPLKDNPNSYLLSLKKDSNPNGINIIHELGHLALFHSGAMEDQKFVSDTISSMENEINKLQGTIDDSFKNLKQYNGTQVGEVFNKVFRNVGKGMSMPSKVDVLSRVLYRKKLNDITMDECFNIGAFCDCLFVASNGTHGFGHDKKYLKDGGNENRIHEFVAHIFEDSVKPNVLLRKHFPNTMSIIMNKLTNKKG